MQHVGSEERKLAAHLGVREAEGPRTGARGEG